MNGGRVEHAHASVGMVQGMTGPVAWICRKYHIAIERLGTGSGRNRYDICYVPLYREGDVSRANRDFLCLDKNTRFEPCIIPN